MDKLLSILKEIKSDVNFETETELVDKGILDSIEIVTIIGAIEENYKLEIDPNDIDPDNFRSVTAMWEMIQRLK